MTRLERTLSALASMFLSACCMAARPAEVPVSQQTAIFGGG
jgi:outer membrane biogenesis lipoprotein LolB